MHGIAAARWAKRALIAVATVVAIAGMGSVLAVSLAAKFGDQALGMKTGSMRPVIDPGDLVLVRQVPTASLRPGQIITFRRPGAPNEIYTHRIFSLTYGSGSEVDIKTKGDANPTPDPWTVVYQGAAAREVAVIRHGGMVLHIAESPDARRVIAGSIFVLVLALMWPVIVGAEGASRRPDPAAGRAVADVAGE